MCQEIGQIMAVSDRRDLCTQWRRLVLSDDSRHHICYLVELESCTLCQNSEEQQGQPVMVHTVFKEQVVA